MDVTNPARPLVPETFVILALQLGHAVQVSGTKYVLSCRFMVVVWCEFLVSMAWVLTYFRSIGGHP